ncbi:MAG: YkgJ family cysteine cluster protein [Phycisphaeraceae bacterium]|nr:YkgJ family cysteine cluster protein [Phycisphaeraceae bacterium]
MSQTDHDACRLDWPAWFAALDQPEIERQLRTIERDLLDAVARRGPTCWISGRCCHFDHYGHRLYLTGLEIAWFARRMSLQSPKASEPSGGALALPQAGRAAPSGDCPFLSGRCCSVHEARPLGCRTFFCQQGTEDWQQALHERVLGRIRRLHDRFQLDYQYLEWRAGLAMLARWRQTEGGDRSFDD